MAQRQQHDIPALLHRLSDDILQSNDVNELLSLLHTLLGDEAACQQIVAAGGLPLLVQRLQSGASMAAKLGAGNLLTGIACKAPDLRPDVAAAGAIPAMLQLLHAAGRHEQQQADSVYLCVAPGIGTLFEHSTTDDRDAVLAAGHLLVLAAVRVLQLYSGPMPCKFAAGLVWELIDANEGLLAAAIAAGVVLALSTALLDSANKGQRGMQCHALAHLIAHSEPLAGEVVACGIVQDLVDALSGSGQSFGEQFGAAHAVCNLAKFHSQAVVDAGGIPALVQLLRRSPDGRAVQGCAGALANLGLTSSEFTQAIAAAGGLAVLRRLARSREVQ